MLFYPQAMGEAFPRRTVRITAIAAGVLVVGAVVLGMWRPWSSLPSSMPVGAGENLPVIAPAPLVIPEDPRVLVFGDSWTYGQAADTPTDGYAYVLADLLHGETIVDGVRGSGYLKPGITGPAYGERIAALDPGLDPDLVIIQGSINDRREGASGYREAVNAAWDALEALYPAAEIVVLGPAPQILPVETETARIDADLSALAAARGWWYISPLGDDWITTQNYLDVIDVDTGNQHPSTAGHRYLAEKLAAALQELTAVASAEAGGTSSAP